jgi:hypothetical protein
MVMSILNVLECDEDYQPTIPERYNKYVIDRTISLVWNKYVIV